jgi:hypothetical protein
MEGKGNEMNLIIYCFYTQTYITFTILIHLNYFACMSLLIIRFEVIDVNKLYEAIVYGLNSYCEGQRKLSLLLFLVSTVIEEQ